jgi:hypothetical protein
MRSSVVRENDDPLRFAKHFFGSGFFRRGATRALRFIVAGTGAVLAGTGTALICTGVALKICGEKIKSFATNTARPEPRPMRRARVVPQPA